MWLVGASVRLGLPLLLAFAVSAACGSWTAAWAFAGLLVLLPPAQYLAALRRVRALSSSGLEETADFVLGPAPGPLCSMQLRGEILPFLRDCLPEPPRAVGEIGRAEGGTLALLCRAAAPDALIVSLDLPGGPHAGPAAALNAGRWKRPLLSALRGPRQRLVLLDGDSRDPASVRRFAEALGGEKLDLLFVDGDHSYDGVRSDFELYSGFVRAGGLIAFHDIVPGAGQGAEVSRFWREYPLPGSRREFVAGPAQAGFGIGVIRLPG